jgi:hypothetical protein
VLTTYLEGLHRGACADGCCRLGAPCSPYSDIETFEWVEPLGDKEEHTLGIGIELGFGQGVYVARLADSDFGQGSLQSSFSPVNVSLVDMTLGSDADAGFEPSGDASDAVRPFDVVVDWSLGLTFDNPAAHTETQEARRVISVCGMGASGVPSCGSPVSDEILGATFDPDSECPGGYCPPSQSGCGSVGWQLNTKNDLQIICGDFAEAATEYSFP